MAATEKTTKAKAWLFDRIVEKAAEDGEQHQPMDQGADGKRRYEPDYATLCQLLAFRCRSGRTRSRAYRLWPSTSGGLATSCGRAGFGAD